MSDSKQRFTAAQRLQAMAGAAAGSVVSRDLRPDVRVGLHACAEAASELTDGAAALFFWGLAKGALRPAPDKPKPAVQRNTMSLPQRTSSRGNR